MSIRAKNSDETSNWLGICGIERNRRSPERRVSDRGRDLPYALFSSQHHKIEQILYFV